MGSFALAIPYRHELRIQWSPCVTFDGIHCERFSLRRSIVVRRGDNENYSDENTLCMRSSQIAMTNPEATLRMQISELLSPRQ
jgi:hypothetical protein